MPPFVFCTERYCRRYPIAAVCCNGSSSHRQGRRCYPWLPDVDVAPPRMRLTLHERINPVGQGSRPRSRTVVPRIFFSLCSLYRVLFHKSSRIVLDWRSRTDPPCKCGCREPSCPAPSAGDVRFLLAPTRGSGTPPEREPAGRKTHRPRRRADAAAATIISDAAAAVAHPRPLRPRLAYCSGSTSPSLALMVLMVLGSTPRPAAKAMSSKRCPCSSPGSPKFPSMQRGSV